MTGGRAYLYDPNGRHVAAVHADSARTMRLSEAIRAREDGTDRFDELFGLLQDHAAIGSSLARRLVLSESLAADTWLVEPVGVPDQRSEAVLDPAASVTSGAAIRA
jgi:glutamate synthase domain-containing protein 3